MATPTRSDLPTIEGESKPFWDAARQGRLAIGHCNSCGLHHYYPRPFCPHCWSEDVALVDASGRATLYTYSIVFMNDLAPFNERLPYVAAMVDLEEGVRLTTNVVECPPEALHIGMPLTVTFEEVTPEISKPVFRPV
jgi:uncharacterized OB-fold protein